MSEEENAPLLSGESGDNNITRNRKLPNLFPTAPIRSNAVCADDRIFVNATVSTPSEIEPDVIVAIFVVAFDTRSGAKTINFIQIERPIVKFTQVNETLTISVKPTSGSFKIIVIFF